MTDPKYKTPNGKIVSEKELKDKYGEKFDSLVKANTFSVVNENVYKTPNGSFETESVLKNKYGDRFNKLVADKVFEPEELKKKEDSGAIYPQQESESEPKLPIPPSQDGSLATTTQSEEKTIPVKVDDEPEEKEGGWANKWRELRTGSARLGESLASIPEAIYRAASWPQNAIAEATGVKSLEASPEKFKQVFDIENPVLDYYSDEVKKLSSETDDYYKGKFGTDEFGNTKRSAWDSFFEEGNYAQGFELLGGGITESAPTSLAMMLGGASMGALKLTAIGTPAFVEQNVKELKNTDLEAFLEMSEAEISAKAFGMAAAETAFMSVGTGTLGKAYKDIIAKEGLDNGKVIFKQGIIKMYETAFKKFGAPISAAGEGLEEMATTATQNAISGKPISENLGESFIQGVGGGVLFGAPMNMIKAKEVIDNNLKKRKVSKVLKGTPYKDVASAFSQPESDNMNDVQASLAEQEVSRDVLVNELDNKVSVGLITQEESDRTIAFFDQTKRLVDAVNGIDLTKEQRAMAINLLKEKEKLSKKVEGKDPNLVRKEIDAIKAIDEELSKVRDEETNETVPENNQAEVPETETDIQDDVADDNTNEAGFDNAENKTEDTPRDAKRLDFNEKSTDELEKRQSQLEDTNDENSRQEFVEIENELIKREWKSVLDSPLNEIKSTVDDLIKKDKEMPNGFGTFIERRDATETKDVAEKYQGEVSKAEAGKDFKNAFFGNPDTWYADALKMRESVRVFIEKGGAFKELLSKVEKEFDQDGFTEQEAAGVIKSKLDKVVKANESTPSSKKPSNTELVAQKKSEPQTTTKRVNPKGVKGEFDVEIDSNGIVKKVVSAKDGREISKFAERSNKKTGKKTLVKNANFSRIANEAMGQMTNNQINEQRKAEISKAVDEFIPSDAYSAALNYLATGGNLNLESASKETGYGKSELKWVTGFKKDSELPSIERASELIAEDSDIELDQTEVRDELIGILQSKQSVSEIQNEIVDLQKELSEAESEQELNAFLGSLSQQEFAAYEAIKAEDDYISELTDAEAIEYYEQEYEKPTEQQEAQNDTEREIEGSSLQERDGAQREESSGTDSEGEVQKEPESEITEQSDDAILDWLNAADKKLDDFSKNNLGIGLPVAVAQGTVKTVRAAYKAGKSATQAIKEALDYIKSTDWYKSLSNKEQKEVNGDLVKQAMVQKTMSEKESFEYVEKTFEEADKSLENKDSSKKKRKSKIRNLIQKLTDRQFISKKLVDEAGAQQTKDAMINGHGASGRAKRIFDEAFKNIYTDRIKVNTKDGFKVEFEPMSNKDRQFLDKIIQLKRFIAIDKNRSERNLPPVTHPGFINADIAKKYLDHLKEKIGDKKFNDLERRSKIYFDTYKDLLAEMKKNGLIGEETFEALNGLDYQPRLFLQHITDFEGNVSLGAASKQKSDTGGLSQEQIKRIGEGSSGVLVRNSEWLLATSIDSRQRAMAMNTVNKLFMTKEFPAAKKRFEELKKDIKNQKKWSREDQRFYEYFQELNSKVKDNPIIKTKKNTDQLEIDGMVPEYIYKRKYDKAPKNFKKAYYYEDGVRQEFFLEENLHDSWFDNIPGFLSTGTKEVIGYATGSSLLKGIATGNNPAFALVNTPRDFIFNVVFSDQYSSFVPKAMIQVAKDTFKSINEIRKSKSSFNSEGNILDKYIYYGGDMAFLSTQGRLKKNTMLAKAINKLIGPRTKTTGSKIFKSVTLRKISEYSEIMFRMALFQRTIKNELDSRGLKSIEEVGNQDEKDMIYMRAVAEARSLLDFNQGGTFTKDAEAFIPYINTAVQGTRVAADAFAKNPVKVTSKVLQSAAMLSGAAVASSLALITANKDEEDEDKTAFEIYLEATEGISRYQRIQYMNIIDGTKDEDGNYRVWKIAKNQQLAPVLNIADNIYTQLISDVAGIKRKESQVNYTEAWTAIQNNIIPIDVTSPITGNITKTPILKAGLTYTTGYDFYRDQPLTFDQNQDNSVMEGAKDKNIEDFYKETGRKFRLSPARLKGAAESLITTPRTNPFVGVLYAGADGIASQDKTLKELAGEVGSDMIKSLDSRLISTTSEFNRQVNRLRPVEGELSEIKTRNDYREVDIEKVTTDFYHDKLTVTEFVEKIKDYSPKEVKKVESKIKSMLKYRDMDRYVIGLAFETDREARALKMAQYYGDVFDGTPENDKIFKQLIELNVLDNETLVEYNKFLNKIKGKKPQD